MALIDIIILALYFAISIGIALYYRKRASQNREEFFLSGRSLPWYLAGVSMVATTFAADTPLAVTELVYKNGIAGNWIWWNFAFGGILTVFFFAKLWRRSGVLTEVEFIELRYGGKTAGFLRGFKAVYLGLFMNVIIIGWVNSAMIAVLHGIFGVPADTVMWYVFGCMALVAAYSAISGLWGVVVTDAFQFILAMGSCIILAIIVLNAPEVGGVAGLKEKLPPGFFSFFPSIGEDPQGFIKTFSLSIPAFFAYIGIQWWASWYPGAEPGGGGYIAQRMLSAKSEKDSIYATLFFQVAHYALRPWPWIIVAMCTVVLYPDLTADTAKMGYIYAINDFLPVGLKGLLIAAFFAAYMSTIATQLNWGASYLMNDLYKRFIDKSTGEKGFIFASRVTTVLIMLVSIVATLFINQISGAWAFIIECGAGLGLVLILRWFWWRINVWSEISAMITPFVIYPFIKFYDIAFPESLFYLTGINAIVWITVTYLTSPELPSVLTNFYRKIQPPAKFWGPIAFASPEIKSDMIVVNMIICWISGVFLVYSMLFGIGSLILGNTGESLIYLAVATVATFLISYFFNKK